MALSGVQKQVLSLYRTAMRSIRSKPTELQPQLLTYLRQEFDKHKAVSPKNHQRVEHLARRGMKQVEMMMEGSVTEL
eukprot:gene11105-18721_t